MRPFFWLGLTLLIGLAVVSRGFSQQPCTNGNCDTAAPAQAPNSGYLHRLGDHFRAKADSCNCGSNGCPAPLGCSNAWTECKFVFGSCKQFFGTGNAAAGHTRATTQVAP